MGEAAGTRASEGERRERCAARPAERLRGRRHGVVTARAEAARMAERQRDAARLAIGGKDQVEEYARPARHALGGAILRPRIVLTQSGDHGVEEVGS